MPTVLDGHSRSVAGRTACAALSVQSVQTRASFSGDAQIARTSYSSTSRSLSSRFGAIHSDPQLAQGPRERVCGKEHDTLPHDIRGATCNRHTATATQAAACFTTLTFQFCASSKWSSDSPSSYFT